MLVGMPGATVGDVPALAHAAGPPASGNGANCEATLRAEAPPGDRVGHTVKEDAGRPLRVREARSMEQLFQLRTEGRSRPNREVTARSRHLVRE
jgi:hypothetical protein